MPWAEHESRFTRDFEDLVAWVAREMNKTAVKDLLHIAWATVGNIVERVVARKLDRTRLERLLDLIGRSDAAGWFKHCGHQAHAN